MCLQWFVKLNTVLFSVLKGRAKEKIQHTRTAIKFPVIIKHVRNSCPGASFVSSE